MKQEIVDRAIVLLRQYREILVASYAPVGPDGKPQLRTLKQSTDPLEMAAFADIVSLDELIGEMSSS